MAARMGRDPRETDTGRRGRRTGDHHITSRFNHRLRKEAENTRGGEHVATAEEIEVAMIEGQKCLLTVTSRHSEHLTKALRTLAREDAGLAAGDGEKESSLDIREDTKENGAPALTISVYTEFSVYTKQTCSAFVPGRAGVIAEDKLRTHQYPPETFPGGLYPYSLRDRIRRPHLRLGTH